MDNLIRQLRVRFSGLEQEGAEKPNNTKEGRLPPQKTVSFKGEKKKVQGWFQRQFSGQMSQGDESSDGEFATVIAATAYAITSLAEEASLPKKKPVEGLHTSLTKTKSKKESSIIKPTDSGRISRWFSGKEAKEDRESVGEISMRKAEAADRKKQEDSTTNQNRPGKGMVKVPTIKKTPTFTDKYLNETRSKKFESAKEKTTGQNASPTVKTTTSSANNWKSNVADSGKTETEADAWEKTKMAKIRKRYEKMNSTILEWENEKKTKAKLRIERQERALELRRTRVLQEYRDEISRIDKIAGGARALADERKRNGESKTIEKANKIRSTGKVPHSCVCF